ncbi:glycosyl hydrolase family 76 protein [Delitschia confertaspora ATCC 74209]|uniref:Mannan endo-1,6-alpha-mannosidase n=1 Tax=Delitschia confertaspora ATCC 74209 TaxID=1513339 RepID=A0A9P4MR97_9PLEO|nr:glycosyl hydrolase family 76 protein [Delitschia confertaspora ATCC 74209]
MWRFSKLVGILVGLNLFSHHVPVASALDLDPTQPSQLKDSAKKVADGLMKLYADTDGKTTKILSGIPGMLPRFSDEGYYWWEAGAMFGQIIEYWYYTKDASYNNLITDGMTYQFGEALDLNPANQTKDMGNDDQLFWAFTMMSAAELNFPDPVGGKPGWLTMAQSVFNQLVIRWYRYGVQNCGGGLRWQLDVLHQGWDYKNTPSNGGFFQLSARLAKYTGNHTYAEWAEKVYDWMAQSPLLTKDYQVYDGTDVKNECIDAARLPWTYNYGIMIAGASYMYNYTNGSDIWRERLQGFINHTAQFFPEQNSGILTEIACETANKCDIDQLSFKAYLTRWLAVAAQLAPFTYDQIMPRLQISARAAAKQCGDGTQCGSHFYTPVTDGNFGVGQQMSALSVISANLISTVPGPYTVNTGGTSKGNPNASTGAEAPPLPDFITMEVTTADKAGAGILTALVIGGLLLGGYFMIS